MKKSGLQCLSILSAALCACGLPVFAAETSEVAPAADEWDVSAGADFRLAPKGASGFDRFEVFGHLVAELFNPGDYFDSSKPAYFVRWQFDFRF